MSNSPDIPAYPSLQAFIQSKDNYYRAFARAAEIALKLRTSPPKDHLNGTHGFLVHILYCPSQNNNPGYHFFIRSIELVSVEEGAALLGVMEPGRASVFISAVNHSVHMFKTQSMMDANEGPVESSQSKPVFNFCVARDFRKKPGPPMADFCPLAMEIIPDELYSGRSDAYWKTDFLHGVDPGHDNKIVCQGDSALKSFTSRALVGPLVEAAETTFADPLGDTSPKTHAILVTIRNFVVRPDEPIKFLVTSVDLITHEKAVDFLSTAVVEATTTFHRQSYYHFLELAAPNHLIPFKAVVVEEGKEYRHGIFTTLKFNGNLASSDDGQSSKGDSWKETFVRAVNGEESSEHDPDFLVNEKKKSSTPKFTCFFCFERCLQEDMKACGSCKVYYCSVECQKKDWKTNHREGCKDVARAREDARRVQGLPR